MKVFVHGVPDTARIWDPVLAALDLPAAQVRTPSLPGFDGRVHPGFGGTARDHVAWLVRRIEDAAADGPVDLVGHDWGALLTAMAALARPDLVRSWVAINAVPEPSFRWHAMARQWQTPGLGEAVMAMTTPSRMRQGLIAAGMPADLAAAEAANCDGPMKATILRLYRSARAPGALDLDIGPIAARAAVLWGANDPFVPLEVARTFCARWSVPLTVEPGVGHWGLVQRPQAFADHIAAHWARV